MVSTSRIQSSSRSSSSVSSCGRREEQEDSSDEVTVKVPVSPKTNRPQQRYLKAKNTQPDGYPNGLVNEGAHSQTRENETKKGVDRLEQEDGKSVPATTGGIKDEHSYDSAQQKANMIDEEHLQRLEQLGTGSMATVFKGTWKDKTVAIKCIHVKVGLKQQISLAREVSIMTNVSHANLVELYGVANSPKIFDIVMEYCAGGDCFDLVHNPEVFELTLQQELKICYDVTLAMKYLHSLKPQIIHRDLKSLNVLLKEPVKDSGSLPWAKISDFGLAKMNAEAAESWEGKMSRVGTGNWMAPEIYTGEYDEKVDVYSFAMFMYEVICSEVPFEEYDSPNVCRDGVRPDLNMLPDDCPQRLSQLMQDCWAHDPKERPPFPEILETMKEIYADSL